MGYFVEASCPYILCQIHVSALMTVDLLPIHDEFKVGIANAACSRPWKTLFTSVLLCSCTPCGPKTWAYLSAVFGACDMTLEDDLYLAGERGISDIIAECDGAQTVMIIGHNPGLHDLALSIMREAGSLDHQAAIRLSSKLPTGSVVLFEAAEDGAFIPSQFRLRNFIKPKDLMEL